MFLSSRVDQRIMRFACLGITKRRNAREHPGCRGAGQRPPPDHPGSGSVPEFDVLAVRTTIGQVQREAAQAGLLIGDRAGARARRRPGRLGTGRATGLRTAGLARPRWPAASTRNIGDAFLKRPRPAGEFFGGGRDLLGGAGVLLRHLVELLDRLVDLDRADILLAARRADLGDQFGGAADVSTSLVNISPGLGGSTHGDVGGQPLISAAAVWLRSASLRTRPPRPRSRDHVPRPVPPRPPRFSANKSVWRAISCTIPIFSAMVRIAITAFCTAVPLCRHPANDWRAIFSVWVAVVGILFDVGGHLLHRSRGFLGGGGLFGRRPGSPVPTRDDSCWLPDATFCAAWVASPTTPRRRSTIDTSAWPSMPCPTAAGD